ncbi:unnamed protein product [Colias eurytheme]|nr:unnamed protein product [Colias eurytheme]
MESWLRAVVLLVAIAAVLGTPLVNDLEPGKEWPDLYSVKQPSEPEEPAYVERIDGETTDDPVNAIAEELPPKNVDEIKEEVPQIIARAAEDEKDDKVDYSGAQVWQVSTEKSGVRLILGRLRRRNLIATWSGNHSYVDVLVKSNAVENVTKLFQRENIDFNIIIDDLQKRINEENPPLDQNEIELQDRRARAYSFWRDRSYHRRVGYIGAYMGYNSLNIPMEYWPNANWGHRMTWKQYHRIEDIHGFLDYLAKTYPAIVSVKSIGKSYEGRELKILRISNGQRTNKAVFIDGGIHAREWISPATVTYLINQIAENFDEESDEIRNIDWYFLPVVNPDGYEYTHKADRLWRKNRKPTIGTRQCIGTDLNRNFGYRWGGKGSSSNPCSDIFRGTRMFSEPESRAVADFITNSAANFSAYLTYHSYGQYLLYPWGYDNAVPPDHKDLDLVGKEIAAAIQQAGGTKYTVGSSSGVLYPAAGGSDDWAKGQGIKYSFTIELSDTGRYGFILPTSFIEPVAKESMAGVRVLAKYLHKT